VPERALAFKAADGSGLRADWRTPEGAGPFPAVACIHGLTLERGQFAGAAAVFAEAGVATLRVDLRGHGQSGGDLKDQGFEDELDDLRSALRALAALPEADASRLGLLGFSLGGALAAVLAPGTPVKALALWSPLLRTGPWDDARQGQYGQPQGAHQPIWDGILVNRRLFSEARAHDPFADAAAWPGPFFVCHGGKDKNHPQARSVELAAARQAAGLPVAACFPPRSGHHYHEPGERALRDRLTAAFFRASLGDT
jgi:dipeptidyl aminopeptidase/acylaminoacyl peptidase